MTLKDLLIESNSPYVPISKGKHSFPILVEEVAKRIAEIKDVSIVVCLNCLSLSTIVTLLWTLGRTVQKQDGSCITLCTPCRPGQESNTCCGCFVEQLRDYINYTAISATDDFMKPEINKQYQDRDLILEPWEVNPSALVEGTRDIKNCYGSCEFQTVKDWRVTYYNYLRNGMDLINGRLFVPESGIYNVYSYLHFRESDGELKHTGMEQRLFRYNIMEREEMELCRHTRPYTESVSGTLRLYGNYMNSDVWLEAGDLIYLKVSNISELQFAERNYFGTYRI
ncbi:hypothetical protein ScPMuIL_018749 [Solemya velum]